MWASFFLFYVSRDLRPLRDLCSARTSLRKGNTARYARSTPPIAHSFLVRSFFFSLSLATLALALFLNATLASSLRFFFFSLTVAALPLSFFLWFFLFSLFSCFSSFCSLSLILSCFLCSLCFLYFYLLSSFCLLSFFYLLYNFFISFLSLGGV